MNNSLPSLSLDDFHVIDRTSVESVRSQRTPEVRPRLVRPDLVSKDTKRNNKMSLMLEFVFNAYHHRSYNGTILFNEQLQKVRVVHVSHCVQVEIVIALAFQTLFTV